MKNKETYYCIELYDDGFEVKGNYDLNEDEELNKIETWIYPPYIKCKYEDITEMKEKLLNFRIEKQIKRVNKELEILKQLKLLKENI